MSANKISFSQISTYYSCPLSWKLRYKDGNYINEPSIYSLFGTAMHETIQTFLKDYYYNKGNKEEFDYKTILLDNMYKLYELEEKEFTNPEQLTEFYLQGINILNELLKPAKLSKIFPKRGYKLIDIEQELKYQIDEDIIFKGYIDIVLHDTKNNKYRIIDIKTSYKGWKKELKDDMKKMQICLYKEYYSKQFNVPLEDIDVEFLIIKRNVFQPKDAVFTVSRIQHVKIPSGKVIMNRHRKKLNEFIDLCYKNYDESKITANTNSCKYCPFKGNLCEET